MEAWNLVRLNNQLNSMKEHKKGSIEEQVIYLLSPFVASLGYDIYDVGQVDVQVTQGRVIVRPVPEVNVVFSVTSMTPSNAKVFVYLDTKRNRMTVQMYAMHKWEIVDVVDIGDIAEPNASIYSSVLRVIAQEAFQIMYAEREERMFTERILRSKLEAGQMNNDFTIATLKTLIERPTEAFLSAIAEVLANNYSTDDHNEIYGLLQPMQQQGIRAIVSDYMKDIPTTDTKPTTPKHVPVQPAYADVPKQEAPKQEAPVYEAPKQEAPVYEAPKPIEPPKEEPTPVVEPTDTAVVEEKPVTEEFVEPKAVTEAVQETVSEPVKEEPVNSTTNDLLNAINQASKEAEQSAKPSSVEDVLINKKSNSNIADLFGGDTRKPPRTKTL